MIKKIFFVFSFSLFTLSVYAQKYPERRITRQGTRAYDRGDFVGAESSYRRALELDPELREAGFNLGNALYRQQKIEDAAQAWMSVAADSLADSSMASAAGFNLGNAALSAQQIDRAIEFYKQSLRIAPDDMHAKYNLAYAQKLKQQQDENQNQDQDQQNEDQNGGGDQQPQPQDPGDQGDQPQDQPQNESEDPGGQGDQPQEGPQDQPQDQPQNDQDSPQDQPPSPDDGPSSRQPAPSGLTPSEAEQMLEAMQAEEDHTREEMEGHKVPLTSKSGKNW